MDIQRPKHLLLEGEGNIDLVKLLSTVPLVVDDNIDTREVADFLLPFGIGIEFECDQKPEYNIEHFKRIPGIVDVNVDKYEQRYRIPKGLEGLKALYHLTRALIDNSLLNLGSGIHYHIGLNEYYNIFIEQREAQQKEYDDYILSELDTWNYKGTYNIRQVGMTTGWVRLQSGFKTAEIRIGEMTFDYEKLFKRITHSCDIFRKLLLNAEYRVLENANPWLKYEQQNIEEIIKNRVKKT